jgi:hypothetical protein
MARLPTNDLINNCAYMMMASLAWTLKAWWGLMLRRHKARAIIAALEPDDVVLGGAKSSD